MHTAVQLGVARSVGAVLLATATVTAQPAPATDRAAEPVIGAPSAPSPAPAADLAADKAFWTSVEKTRDPAELLAYLKAFPDGQFAVLARLRLDALRGETDGFGEAVIRDVQHRLYALNYDVTAISGRLDPATVAAIRRWQQVNGLIASGTLDAAQLATLRSQQPPTTWAALAFSGSIREIATSASSRKEAEARALAACFQKAAGRECRVLAVGGTQCIAAAAFRMADGGVSTVAILRRTLADAQVGALTGCSEDPKSAGNCEIVAKVCANAPATTSPNAPPPARSGPKAREQDT
jgi:peptidoglycan hydrolase-like protein with peptidoglycan-binding domain